MRTTKLVELMDKPEEQVVTTIKRFLAMKTAAPRINRKRTLKIMPVDTQIGRRTQKKTSKEFMLNTGAPPRGKASPL
jgi:hypothetical protein